MHWSFVATFALLSSLAIATPAPSVTPASTPDSLNVSISVPDTRITNYPVCGTPGFTSEPGDNDLGIFPPPPVPHLKECIWACRLNITCKAVSYAKKFQLCSFYGAAMQFDHLDEDNESNFAHYDKYCYVEGDEVLGEGVESEGKGGEGKRIFKRDSEK